MGCSFLLMLDKWATAPGAVMGQNGNGIDQAGAVLFCYPPHSPALLDKKSSIQTL
jgi:hypothetical protein